MTIDDLIAAIESATEEDRRRLRIRLFVTKYLAGDSVVELLDRVYQAKPQVDEYLRTVRSALKREGLDLSSKSGATQRTAMEIAGGEDDSKCRTREQMIGVVPGSKGISRDQIAVVARKIADLIEAEVPDEQQIEDVLAVARVFANYREDVPPTSSGEAR